MDYKPKDRVNIYHSCMGHLEDSEPASDAESIIREEVLRRTRRAMLDLLIYGTYIVDAKTGERVDRTTVSIVRPGDYDGL